MESNSGRPSDAEIEREILASIDNGIITSAYGPEEDLEAARRDVGKPPATE
jgi:hypothetical protein